MRSATPASVPQRSRLRGTGVLLSFALASLVLAGGAAGVASAGSTDPAAPAAATSAAATPTTTYVPSGGVAASATTTTTPAATTAGAATAGVTPTTLPATTTPTVSVPATGTPQASTPTPAKAGTAQAKKSNRDRPLSTGAIVIAALALLLLLGCIAWALARRRAFEPHWLLSLRHAMAEAGFRASATWSEFADWARLGR